MRNSEEELAETPSEIEETPTEETGKSDTENLSNEESEVIGE